MTLKIKQLMGSGLRHYRTSAGIDIFRKYYLYLAETDTLKKDGYIKKYFNKESIWGVINSIIINMEINEIIIILIDTDLVLILSDYLKYLVKERATMLMYGCIKEDPKLYY